MLILYRYRRQGNSHSSNSRYIISSSNSNCVLLCMVYACMGIVTWYNGVKVATIHAFQKTIAAVLYNSYS